jgi:hypothetical protein
VSNRTVKPETGPLAFFLLTVERLTDAVERETRDLDGPGPVDYRAHSQRKSQGLLELSRIDVNLAGMRSHPRARAALGDLLGKLEKNQKILHARLRAARTISEVLARTIRDGQSDGTYSAQIWRENRR